MDWEEDPNKASGRVCAFSQTITADSWLKQIKIKKNMKSDRELRNVFSKPSYVKEF